MCKEVIQNFKIQNFSQHGDLIKESAPDIKAYLIVLIGFKQEKSGKMVTYLANIFTMEKALLIGELIVYSWFGVRRRSQFQTSSLKPLGQSKPNFMWSLHG